jgi:hypothetical protein
MLAHFFAAIDSLLLGFAGGVVAWFLTNFYGRPLTRFFELRDQAHEEIVFTNNLSPMVDPQRIEKGAEVLPRHSGMPAGLGRRSCARGRGDQRVEAVLKARVPGVPPSVPRGGDARRPVRLAQATRGSKTRDGRRSW